MIMIDGGVIGLVFLFGGDCGPVPNPPTESFTACLFQKISLRFVARAFEGARFNLDSVQEREFFSLLLIFVFRL